LSIASCRKSGQGAAFIVFLIAIPSIAHAQVESVAPDAQQFVWVSHGRVEGHLALASSPAGAFSIDSSSLAVVNGEKVVMMNLSQRSVEKVLEPRIPGLKSETLDSANFVAPDVVFLLGTGVIVSKGHGSGEVTPLLGFRWNTQQNALAGKVDTIGAGGGGAIHYLSHVGYLGIYKDSTFQLWNPSNGRTLETKIPDLTRQPNVFTFSPDGHWLIVAQLAGGGMDDPIVVRLSEHQFVNSLRGHKGAVLSVEFSADSQKVVTACEDGNVRIYSVPDWKLLETLTGHDGPVHWADFSPDGQWIASAGEDHTVRIWSAADGKLLQTLSESRQPLLTVAFSPNGQYLAASSEKAVLIWQRTAAGD
jgi:WD domain, G-beta repeat